MNKTTFEEEIQRSGKLIYTNVGTSMMPLLRQGRDLMVIVPPPKGRCKKYDAPLYKRKNGEYVLHRILKVRKDDYVICGDHCLHREFGVTDRQIIGVLAAVMRDGKTSPVTDLRYRCYVHLWCDFFYFRVWILWIKSCCIRVGRKLKRMISHKTRNLDG